MVLLLGCGGGSASSDGAAADAAGGTGGLATADGRAGAGGAAGLGGAGAADAGAGDSKGPADVGDARGADAGAADAGGPICGFVMPNPASSGLPNPARYDTTVAGIVSDQVTGLSWERQLTGHTASEGCTVNITGLLYCPLRYAAAYCAASRLGGFADWRVPTVTELISLVDFTQWYPSIDGVAFPETPYESFWSSTRFGDGQLDYAWQVSFALGSNSPIFIDQPVHVRCVRTGGAPPPRCAPAGERYQVSGDQATDVLTGLTWQRGVGSSQTSPAQAAADCAALGSGFRVPSIKELYTLVDYRVTQSSATPLDLTVFDRPQSFFWSSSVDIGDYMSIWVLDLQDGNGGPSVAGPSYTNGAIKCVR